MKKWLLLFGLGLLLVAAVVYFRKPALSYEEEFSLLCDVYTKTLTAPSKTNEERRVLLSETLSKKFHSPRMREFFGALSVISPSDRYLFFKKEAESLGIQNWECAVLKEAYPE